MSAASGKSGRDCQVHCRALAWEAGGHDRPTMTGRWYCPDCQTALMTALDALRPSADSDTPDGAA